MRYILYFIEETGIYLRENKLASVMTTLTIAFTMLIFGVFLFLYLNFSSLMNNLQSEIRILLYLDDRVSSSQVKRIQKSLETEPEIDQIRYISKEQALVDFQGSSQGSDLLGGLGENLLPASFELTIDPEFRSSELMAGMVDRLKKIPGIDEVQYGREWVENIESWVRLLRMGAVGIGGLLAFTVTAIIANTIQLTLLSRKNEMEILKLIGATRGFIGIPFILEGTLIGFVSSGLALLLLFGFHQLLERSFVSISGMFLSSEGIAFLPIAWVAGFFLMGMGLGSLGSYWSLRRWI